ncbi:hypothetical protein AB0A63_01055 [Lentzea sp. NPDC042327]|uniref:hypothetical protein n=1 Tax=Lentzea sp. NPDC042327 TaxID=3154801 RepID=UPI0033E93AF6
MRAGGFLRWVAHPVSLGAAAVLLLNDHVLKRAWPGLVTGKLSDVAGLVVAPAVLGLLAGLLRAGRAGAAAAVVLTGAGFAWVKTTAVGAEVASAAWSLVNGPSVVLADPTDLVALPALGLAWWTWRRAAAAPPLPDGLAHRLRVVLAVPFAVLAVGATSAPYVSLPAVDSVRAADGGRVVVEIEERFYGSPTGLGDWTPLPQPPPEHRLQTEACVPGTAAHCYRVHGGGELDLDETPPRGGRLLGVDETTDGGRTWRTAWEVPAARWSFIERRHLIPSGVDRSSKIASVDLLVRQVPGGHEVFVANGAEGMAVRGTDGTWRAVPVVVPATGLDVRPSPLTGFGQVIGDHVRHAGLVTALALLLGMAVAVSRSRTRPKTLLPFAALLASSLPVAGWVSFFFTTADETTPAPLLYALGVAAVGVTLTLVQDSVPRRRAVVVGVAAVLAGVAFLAPLLGWTAGWPADHDLATQLGLVTAVVWSFVMCAAGWWAGSAAPNRPEWTPSR